MIFHYSSRNMFVSMALRQIIYYFLSKNRSYFFPGHLQRVPNCKHGSARDNLAKTIDDDTIHFYSSLSRGTGFLSLVTSHASLLYYSYTQLRRFSASWKTGSPLILLSFFVPPFLPLSFFLFLQVVRPPAGYTKTTGFLLSRWRLAIVVPLAHG